MKKAQEMHPYVPTEVAIERAMGFEEGSYDWKLSQDLQGRINQIIAENKTVKETVYEAQKALGIEVALKIKAEVDARWSALEDSVQSKKQDIAEKQLEILKLSEEISTLFLKIEQRA